VVVVLLVVPQVDGKRQLLMSGQGASPEGNKPFLDLLDIDTKETTRLWQSSPPYLESVGSIMSDNNEVSLHPSNKDRVSILTVLDNA